MTIDIDDSLLAIAAKVLGTKRDEDTVNRALQEIAERLEEYAELQRERRSAALRELQEMAARGDIDIEGLQEMHDAEKAIARKMQARWREREEQT